MDWDVDERPQQQQQQQPINASMLMLQHYQNPGLPTRREYFSSSIFQQQQHPVSLHNSRASSYHPSHLIPRSPGQLFSPAVYSGAAAAHMVPTAASMGAAYVGAASMGAAAVPVEATQNVFSSTPTAAHTVPGAAAVPVEATQGVSARAVAAHGELLGAPLAASECQRQPAACYLESASPEIALPAMFQPGGVPASSPAAAAANMRPIAVMGSAARGGGGAASVRATAIFHLPNFQLPGFQVPGRPLPPPPVITHTWTGRRTLPQPAASVCLPAATAGIPCDGPRRCLTALMQQLSKSPHQL
ncbi:unnamed protein product [Closterium sp. NIES-64]|nr:unnamed protein product [Closterium sp. NIES-64]